MLLVTTFVTSARAQAATAARLRSGRLRARRGRRVSHVDHYGRDARQESAGALDRARRGPSHSLGTRLRRGRPGETRAGDGGDDLSRRLRLQALHRHGHHAARRARAREPRRAGVDVPLRLSSRPIRSADRSRCASSPRIARGSCASRPSATTSTRRRLRSRPPSRVSTGRRSFTSPPRTSSTRTRESRSWAMCSNTSAASRSRRISLRTCSRRSAWRRARSSSRPRSRRALPSATCGRTTVDAFPRPASSSANRPRARCTRRSPISRAS